MLHKKFLSRKNASFITFVLGLMLSVGTSVWATSIGNDVSISGTLTTTGDSTLSGALTITGNTTVNGSLNTLGDASTDVNLFTGTLQASTTALFTNGLITYGNSTFGDAATDVNLFTGTLQASTTALFTSGLTAYGNLVANGGSNTFGDASTDVNLFTGTLQASTTALFTSGLTAYGNLNVNGFATTTAASGNFATNGTLVTAGTATSTWASAGLSVAGGGLVSSQGLTLTGGSLLGTNITATLGTTTLTSLTSSNTSTSTFSGGVSTVGLSSSQGLVLSGGSLSLTSSATSTLNNGFNVTAGCFAINGTCVAGGSGTVNSGTGNALTFYPSTGTTVDDASLVSWNDTVKQFTVGTTTAANNTILTVGATSTGSVALSLKGVAGQTGNYVQILNSADTQLVTISSDGNLTTAGSVNASTTFAVTGVSSYYGDLRVNGFATTTAASGNFATQGSIYASSTMAVTGATAVYGNFSVNGRATTTASNGNFATIGTTSVGTSSPAQELSVAGDLFVGLVSPTNGATSTVTIDSARGTTGACINLRATDGSMIRIYATTTPAGSGLGYQNLVVEAGSCQ